MKIQTALKDLSYQIIWGEADQEAKEVILRFQKGRTRNCFCLHGGSPD